MSLPFGSRVNVVLLLKGVGLKKYIIKQTVDEWLKTNEVTKVPLNYAQGATVNGSVCSGRFSKGLSGGHGEHRYQSSNLNFSKDKGIRGFDKEKQSIKKHHEKLEKTVKGLRGRPTEKQREFMKKHGLRIYPNMNKKKAFKSISNYLSVKKTLSKENRLLRNDKQD